MHKNFRILAAASILLAFGALSAFANGQTESSKLSGTISTIQPIGNNMVTVVLSTKNGPYTVDVSQSVLTATSLQVGQQITLSGVLHQLSDGTKSVDPQEIEVDGKQYSVPQSPTQPGTPGITDGSSGGNGSGPETSQSPETPEPSHAQSSDNSPDSSGSGSHGKDS